MLVDELGILEKTKNCKYIISTSFFSMQELNYDENSNVLNHKDKVISFECKLQENLQGHEKWAQGLIKYIDNEII